MKEQKLGFGCMRLPKSGTGKIDIEQTKKIPVIDRLKDCATAFGK